jgi:hypothetical protein
MTLSYKHFIFCLDGLSVHVALEIAQGPTPDAGDHNLGPLRRTTTRKELATRTLKGGEDFSHKILGDFHSRHPLSIV